MSKGAFISSALLHGVVLTLMTMEFSFSHFDKAPPPAILMVDLTKVQITDKTNLPPKVQPVKKQPKTVSQKAPAPTPRPTKVAPKIPDPPKPKPIPEPPQPKAVPVVEKTNPKPEQEHKQKVTPKAQPEPKTPPKKQAGSDLKKLLASVEKVRQNAPVSQTPVEPEEMRVSDGIEGGTEGSISQVLTISERDLIARQLSDCWNVDGGKEGIENLIVEVRVHVNKDGSVGETSVLNMPSDPVHKSVAESAERAVHICDKSDTSPFKILAEKYADHYGDWRLLRLRFSPLHGVM